MGSSEIDSWSFSSHFPESLAIKAKFDSLLVTLHDFPHWRPLDKKD